MSQEKFIAKLIGLKDPHIHFTAGTQAQSGQYHGHPALLLRAKLITRILRCPNCGFTGCLVKYGYRTVNLKLSPQRYHLIILRLAKQRFRCNRCGSIITSQTNAVSPNCQISKNVWQSIVADFHDNMAATLIAKQNGVSTSTVNRAYPQAAQMVSNHFVHLPEHLSFDEFTSSHQNRRMRFIFQDADQHDRIVILYGRRKAFLRNYFLQYSYRERARVKTISVDLNAGYVHLIPEIFPNAKIIIDRFHIVQMTQRSLNEMRLSVARQYKRSSWEYRLTKKYWRLFNKPLEKLEAKRLYYRVPLKREMTSQRIVTDAVSLSPKFTKVYQTYQNILGAIQKHDEILLAKTIHEYRTLNCSMDATILTLKHNLKAVINSLRYPYSNGPLEGVNRKIKAIGRTAYGYRNFDHYRTRIQMELIA
ncbi:MAG: ISL3 family transposase [Lactiplantibacillus plantarum]|nr:ISL3 family transposase [Lactiplantibacillus plantarum]